MQFHLIMYIIEKQKKKFSYINFLFLLWLFVVDGEKMVTLTVV